MRDSRIGWTGIRSVQYRVEFFWKPEGRIVQNVVGLSVSDGNS